MVKELGFLRIGDCFYLDGKLCKAVSLGDRDINNVNCVEIDTNKRIRLDVTTEVEVIDNEVSNNR